MRTLRILMLWVSFFTTAVASEMITDIHLVSKAGFGKKIGIITFKDTQYGLLVSPSLDDLPPGVHGFHIHSHPSCQPEEKDKQAIAALSAGGHLDPKETHRHAGPYVNNDHLGDLPVLIVNKNGQANLPVLAPKLTVQKIQHHSVIIHAHGDNYSDQPLPLGGGGARIACGVIN